MSKELIQRKNKVYQAGADRDLTDELRESAQRSLYVLSKGVLGMKDFTPHLHKPLCDWMQGNKRRKRVMLIPRSCFKTSMARCLGLHVVIQPIEENIYFPGREGCNIRLLYAAETETRALSRIGWIRRQLQGNDLFRALWPHLVWKNHTTEPAVWTNTHFAVRRTEDYPEATFEAAGVDSGSTGSHYDGIIKDDLIGLRSRKQPALINAAIEWFQTSHSLTDNLNTYIDWVFGTRWAAWDLYEWMVENEPSYDWMIKSIINHNFDEKSIIFPERFNIEEILALKKKQGELFYLNYMNKATGGGTTAFNMEMCFKFTLDGLTIDYDEDPATERITEIIEEGKKPVAKESKKPKKLWEMTAQERQDIWLNMQKNFYRHRETLYEVS